MEPTSPDQAKSKPLSLASHLGVGLGPAMALGMARRRKRG